MKRIRDLSTLINSQILRDGLALSLKMEVIFLVILLTGLLILLCFCSFCFCYYLGCPGKLKRITGNLRLFLTESFAFLL